MNKMHRLFAHSLILGAAFLINLSIDSANAADTPAASPTSTPNVTTPVTPNMIPSTRPVATQPQLSTPAAPVIDAKAYVLMDAYSGKILAAQNPDIRLPPASLTKMMTSYVISGTIRDGRVKLDDTATVSEKAWRTGGSKMFVKVGDAVPVRDLMQGIIVDSGNDACVTMAEHVAGTEDAFVNLMNQTAAALGMTGTHFTDANGLPNPDHYTTAQDMAILARHLVLDFPEDYKWYSQKWFTYNNIKQPNRNRLLWRDTTVDGIKTGHTDDAGFCLVSSAQRNNMRLISVVMGAPSDAARAEDSQKLLTYGFRFFEAHKFADAGTQLSKVRVWYGQTKSIPVGTSTDLYVTTPVNQNTGLKLVTIVTAPIKAPIKKGQVLGSVQVLLNNDVLVTQPLVALQNNHKAGAFSRMTDSLRLGLRRVLGGDLNA